MLNNLFEKKEKINLEFIKQQLESKKLVIATVNRNILQDIGGYKGHFILIKGFDEENFICNDSYLGEDLKIPYGKFKTAFYRNSEAEIVVIG